MDLFKSGYLFLDTNSIPSISLHVNAHARYMTVGTKNDLSYHDCFPLCDWPEEVQNHLFCSACRLSRTPRHIYAYADASWADVIPSRKSTYCYLLFCNNAIFSWKSAVASLSLFCQLRKPRWLHCVVLHKKLPFVASSQMNLASGNSAQHQYTKTTLVLKLLQKQAISKNDPNITSFDGNWLQQW